MSNNQQQFQYSTPCQETQDVEENPQPWHGRFFMFDRPPIEYFINGVRQNDIVLQREDYGLESSL